MVGGLTASIQHDILPTCSRKPLASLTPTSLQAYRTFKGILSVLGLKEPATIDVTLEGNQVTGTYKEKVRVKQPTLKIATAKK